MTRVCSALLLACLLLGCSKKDEGSPPEPGKPSEARKADFTVTADEYFEERKKDEKATRAKYAGKVLDIKATLFTVTIRDKLWQASVAGGEHPTLKVPMIQQVFLTSDAAGKEKELRLLSNKQQVTIRALGNDGPGFEFSQAKIIDSGPTTAKVATLAEVDTALRAAKDENKTDSPDILVRIRFEALDKKDAFSVGYATDAGTPGGPRYALHPFSFTDTWKDFEALKTGDIVTVMGGPRTEFGRGILGNARIVKEAPAGLQMPVEKK